MCVTSHKQTEQLVSALNRICNAHLRSYLHLTTAATSILNADASLHANRVSVPTEWLKAV